MSRVVRSAIACLAIAGALAESSAAQGAPPAPALPTASAQPLVHFDLRLLDGAVAHVGPREPVTVIAIFATWCRSCADDVAMFSALWRDLAAQRVRFVALNVDKPDAGTVQRWLDGHHASYSAALDTDGAISRALGVVGVPEIYVISGEGRVTFVRRGPVGSMLPALRKAATGN